MRYLRLLGLSACLLSAISCQGGGPQITAADLLELMRPPTQKVVTQRYDNGRTGVAQHEHILTPAALRSGEFGIAFSFPVTGQIYGQPLYLPRVRSADGTTHSLMVVATMMNIVYVFDVDGPLTGLGSAPRDSLILGPPVPFNFMPMAYTDWMLGMIQSLAHYSIAGIVVSAPLVPATAPAANSTTGDPYNIFPSIGIASTPVIDTTTTTLFLTEKTMLPGGAIGYRLHALSIMPALAERAGSPVAITGAVPGTGLGSVGGTLTFSPTMHLQRPALLLSGGTLYVAFGSHQDTPPWHGWVFAFNPATLANTGVFCTSPNGLGAGIWQAGSGLVADPAGSVYLMTGNAAVPIGAIAVPNPFGQSFVKLSPTLGVLASFKHPVGAKRDGVDADLGSAGPVLIPGGSLIVGAGKDGMLFVLNAADLTEATSRQVAHAQDLFSISGSGYHHVHGTPVVWRDRAGTDRLYVWPERDRMRSFSIGVSGGTTTVTPLDSTTFESPSGSMPGGMLTLSTDSEKTSPSVLWATLPIKEDALKRLAPGVLRAFDANDLTTELWHSQMRPTIDSLGLLAKNSPPTVADGRVYVATFGGRVAVYGLRQWAKYVTESEQNRNVTTGTRIGPLITMLNGGIRTWTPASGDALRVTLTDATTGAVAATTDIPLPMNVSSGGLIQIDAGITGSATPGTFKYDAIMVTSAFGGGPVPFGEKTPTLNIQVAAP